MATRRDEDEGPYAEGVTPQSPGSRHGKAAKHTLGYGSQRSPCAEGVTPHRPGSHPGEDATRTLGYGSHNTQIPRRGFTNNDATTKRDNIGPVV